MTAVLFIAGIALAALAWRTRRRPPLAAGSDQDAAGSVPPADRGARVVHSLMLERAQWPQVLSSCGRLLDDDGRLDLQRVSEFYSQDPHRGLSLILSACQELAAKDQAATFRAAVTRARVLTWGDV